MLRAHSLCVTLFRNVDGRRAVSVDEHSPFGGATDALSLQLVSKLILELEAILSRLRPGWWNGKLNLDP